MFSHGFSVFLYHSQLASLQDRVLARISKMHVQNSNFKISARPDLATNLLQILIPAKINSLVCQKGQFALQLCPKRRFVRKIFGYYTPKGQNGKIFLDIFACPSRRFLGNYLSKRQAGRVLAKSLLQDNAQGHVRKPSMTWFRWWFLLGTPISSYVHNWLVMISSL